MKYLLAILIASFLISSCSGPNTNVATDAARIDSLKNKYVEIIDSLDYSWKVMIENDDLKLAYMKRLVDEITYTNQFEQSKVQDFYDRIEKVKSMRYDRESMANTELIDEYDFAIASLITEIETYAKSNPRFENFPTMEELINDIRNLDTRVLFERVDYDDFAKEYNSFIDANNDLRQHITEDNFSRQPLFEISQ